MNSRAVPVSLVPPLPVDDNRQDVKSSLGDDASPHGFVPQLSRRNGAGRLRELPTSTASSTTIWSTTVTSGFTAPC